MAQITEDYVSYETAKLLKEKGFDAECKKYYNLKMLTNLYYGCEYVRNRDLKDEDDCIAPSLWMAMKWLRKVHKIFISLNTSFLYPIRYHCEIFCYGDNLKTQQDVITENFENPEEACEAAIKYCLENLI